MPTPHSDRIWQRASARWAEIQAISPDLADSVALQQRLVGLILEASKELTDTPPPGLTEDAITSRWRRGVPALRNAPVPLPAPLTRLVALLCEALAAGGAGDAAVHIGDAVRHGAIDAGSLVAVSLARNQKAIRTSALHMGFSPDLVWLIGELASSPLAARLQEQILGMGPGALFERVELEKSRWDRGYCPFCGSWPVFIESCRGERRLRCSFCTFGWTLSTHRCVYCGNAGEDFVVAAPDMQRRDRRMELCAKCGSYTKVLDVAEATPFPLLAIEDLATLDLDSAAMDRGYRRPELYDLDSIEPPTPTC